MDYGAIPVGSAAWRPGADGGKEKVLARASITTQMWLRKIILIAMPLTFEVV